MFKIHLMPYSLIAIIQTSMYVFPAEVQYQTGSLNYKRRCVVYFNIDLNLNFKSVLLHKIHYSYSNDNIKYRKRNYLLSPYIPHIKQTRKPALAPVILANYCIVDCVVNSHFKVKRSTFAHVTVKVSA